MQNAKSIIIDYLLSELLLEVPSSGDLYILTALLF
jgi:hypothetical protein